MSAPPKASKIVMTTTLLPTAFNDDALKEQPIVKAMKPKAISLIQLIAAKDVGDVGSLDQPPMYWPKTYGPKTIPDIKYPVTFGSLSNFIKRDESRPVTRAIAMQSI